jgi:hypothetical protein
MIFRSYRMEIQNLTWLKAFRFPGGLDNIIELDFRRPDFENPRILHEKVRVRIDSIEGRTFSCTVVCQPKKDWRINKGDRVLVEYYFFENAYWLACTTVEEKFGFEWL